MAAIPHVLVVAPDRDFRRSLEFALETEGFSVDAPAASHEALLAPVAEVDCMVVDDDAVDDWPEAVDAFRRFGRPVVLLVGKARSIPSLPFMTILSKPFLGAPLIEAVRNAATHHS